MGVALGMMLGTVWHFKGANPQIRVFGISSQKKMLSILLELPIFPRSSSPHEGSWIIVVELLLLIWTWEFNSEQKLTRKNKLLLLLV